MPFTTPLKDLPTAYPNPQAPLVEDSKQASPQMNTLLQQIRDYLATVDAALRELEP